MYHKAYGIIETQAPLHVGATAGEETGNLNLIFRDQFTKTGIIPGSSIRGRFRADMRSHSHNGDVATWYGHEAIATPDRKDGGTTEALVKFEYASLVWLPVFCPGQPIVWVSCPSLLKRYKQIAEIKAEIPQPYTADPELKARAVPGTKEKVLFFNLGFLGIEHSQSLADWVPAGADLQVKQLVVVHDNNIAMLHDMALYRQSRIKMLDDMKKVDTQTGAFFNVEALPVGSVLVFPVALKKLGWKPFGEPESNQPYSQELYFGGLESIGFGRCKVTLAGEAFSQQQTETLKQEV
ncbi:MAG TPA: type III-B CRISPR module RAMP protein Cmr4 [Cyanobacteria bacterium UBA8803]|nr:type III-B CRISPR module RAMP protein Cmr4 [Cyanobacteria bacterium UBA9273]HBL62296.1 type III-B CRISPR module RAMP protein Cmr4 [Cyanobacteria bacterium UBA8803]